MMVYDHDRMGAEKQYERAREINPNYAISHQWYGEYLAAPGRDSEAHAEVKLSLELDLPSLNPNMAGGLIFYFVRRYDDSIAQLEKTLSSALVLKGAIRSVNSGGVLSMSNR